LRRFFLLDGFSGGTAFGEECHDEGADDEEEVKYPADEGDFGEERSFGGIDVRGPGACVLNDGIHVDHSGHECGGSADGDFDGADALDEYGRPLLMGFGPPDGGGDPCQQSGHEEPHVGAFPWFIRYG